MCGQGDGEEQLVVLAAVEGACGHVHVQFLGHRGRLVVKRDALLIHTAAHVALCADVQQLAAQAVADVYHAGGVYAGLAQRLDDVAARLGLQLPLKQVLTPAHVGLEILQAGQFLLVARLACLGQLLVIDGTLALEQLQAHVGGTQVTAHTDEVGVARAVAAHGVGGAGLAYRGDTDGQARETAGGVTAHDIHMVLGACLPHAAIELCDVLYLEAAADGQAHGYLAGRSAHGVHIAQIDHHGLVAQAVEWHIGEVEVYALHQEVGGDQCARALGRSQDGTIVPHALDGGGILGLDV